jgi:hypothetical protein
MLQPQARGDYDYDYDYDYEASWSPAELTCARLKDGDPRPLKCVVYV